MVRRVEAPRRQPRVLKKSFLDFLSDRFHWFSSYSRSTFLLVSAIAVMLLYGPSLAGPFVYDDVSQIEYNKALSSLNGIWRFITAPVPFAHNSRSITGSFYRPLFWITLALERKLWGADPFGFHLINLLLQIANGFLLYLLIYRLNLLPKLIGAFCSFVWILLPTSCEAIAWISGCTYPLCFLFILLALHSVVSYVRKPGFLFAVCYACAFFLACFSNEAGILTLPFTCLLIYGQQKLRLRSWVPFCSCVLGVTGVYFALREIVGARASSAHLELFPVGLSILAYLRLFFFPLHLSIDRSTLTPTNNASLASILALLIVLLLFVLAIWLRRRIHAAAFGLAWALLGLLPYSGVIPLYQGMAERYLYISSAGLVIAIGAFAYALPPRGRRIAFLIAIVWTCGYALRLHARALAWTNPIALYRDSLVATPASALLEYNLGAVYEQKGDYVEAAKAYKKTLALDPHYAQAIAGMGNVDLQTDELRKAEQEYKKAISANPKLTLAWKNLGVLFILKAQYSEAVPYLKRAITLDPQDPSAYTALGIAYQKSGDVRRARRAYEKALSLNPDGATASHNLQLLDNPTTRTTPSAMQTVPESSPRPDHGPELTRGSIKDMEKPQPALNLSDRRWLYPSHICHNMSDRKARYRS